MDLISSQRPFEIQELVGVRATFRNMKRKPESELKVSYKNETKDSVDIKDKEKLSEMNNFAKKNSVTNFLKRQADIVENDQFK